MKTEQSEKNLSIDDFPGLKAIKEELLRQGWEKVVEDDSLNISNQEFSIKTFNDLKVGDIYYQLVIGNSKDELGKVVMSSYDITDIVRHDNREIVEFNSTHPYVTETGKGCSFHTMSISYDDMDKSLTTDGRGYKDIVYITEESLKDEAAKRLIKNVCQLDKEEIENHQKEIDRLIKKHHIMMKELMNNRKK